MLVGPFITVKSTLLLTVQIIIEVGHINKALYLLNYIDDEDYRLAQLNRGESHHAVVRAICHEFINIFEYYLHTSKTNDKRISELVKRATREGNYA